MKKTIFSVIFSNFAAAGIAFILNIALARLLSVEEYGRINLVFTIVILIFSILEFSFSNANVIFYNKFKVSKESLDDNILIYLNKLFLKYFLSTFPILLLLIYIFLTVYDLNTIETIAIAINASIFIVFRHLLSLQQAVGSWKIYNGLNIANSLLKAVTMLVTIICFWLWIDRTNSLYLTALSSYIVFAVILAFVTYRYSKNVLLFDHSVHKMYKFSEYKKIIIPLGISNIFIILASRADIFIIEKYIGSESLGIYIAANSLALVFPLITSALRNVFIKESAEKKVTFLEEILKYQLKYLPYIFVLYLLIFFVSDYTYAILFGEKYMESSDIFKILVIAYIGGIVFTPLESYFYSHEQKKIMILKLSQMILVIGASLLLIQYHLIGVASAVLISRLFGWLYIYYLAVKRVNKEKYEKVV